MSNVIKFKMLSSITAILMILLILPTTSEADQISWDSEIHKGESYSWKYIKNEEINTNNQIQVGDMIKIDILQNLDQLKLTNQSCRELACNFQLNSSEILSQYFSMTLNGTVVDPGMLSSLLPIFILPITYIDNSGSTHSFFSSSEYVTKNGDEYIYKYSRTIPDASSNITIIWQKSGVMNFYDVILSSFGGPSHVTIIREGYNTDTSNTIGVNNDLVFPALIFAVLIYRNKSIKRHMKL